jgi:starch-binding outer membrane protein, SusD/RagB family
MKKIFHHKKSLTAARLASVAAMILLGSCTKNILNTTPTTSISSSVAYSTSDKILAAVNGLYTQTENGAYYGGSYLVYNEQRGEEFSQNSGNPDDGISVWNQAVSASSEQVNNLWGQAYTTINSANLLIGNITGTSVISDSLIANYTAEGKFIRALAYFSLVQTYAHPHAQDSTALALPLRLTGNTSGNNNLAFSTVSQVYAQIIKDLDDAEAGLPVSYSTPLLNVSRANKSSAIALKTRVFLAQGNYAAVITEASKIVSAGAPFAYTAGTITHNLEAHIATVFNGSYIGNEAIFSLPFVTAAEAPGEQAALAYFYLFQPVLVLNPAGIFADTVFSSPTSADARKGLIKADPVSGYSLLNKFSINSIPFLDYVPVIRYAEVLLNYAEAAAQTGNLTLATELLQAVRARSNPAAVFPSASTATSADLTATILNERRIELLGEGFRAPDLLRRVQTLPSKTGAQGTAVAVSPTDPNYYWPVPSGEDAYNNLAPH